MRWQYDDGRGCGGARSGSQSGKHMRSSVLILLASLGGSVTGAEKTPLNIFLNDIRVQLYSMAQVDEQDPLQVVVSNIHVEMNVVVEKDQRGRPSYFVLDGVRSNQGVVTQRISFDMELQPNRSGSRFYSTRRRDNPPDSDRHTPHIQSPYPPGPYMPDIYPVILYDRHR